MISSLELARICGISQGTVDRALHGRPGVSAKTKALVEAAAREHGYRPNPVARELLSGESRVLGALVPAVNVIFFMDFMQALKEASDGGGLRLFITPVADKEEFLAALEDFAARRVKGVLAVPTEDGIAIPMHLEKALPIATLLSPVANESIPLFAPDERATGAEAVRYLAERGHERILHVTYRREAFPIHERKTGYAEAMAKRGLSPEICIFSGPEALYDAMQKYRPTALFCHNDALALAVMRLLEAQRLSVPADISVLGVDNSPTFNEFQADITTLAYPTQEIAQKAVRWLTDEEDQRPISPLRLIEKRTVRARA